MPSTIGWAEIALRLGLTCLGGALLGLNRTERGRAAGLRTMLLVCLAAAISMLQVNLMLLTSGKTPDSFVVMDLMRLPLGILTGVGFIGAGAILRREDTVMGVTTAATLWFGTVMGLCLGGGQIGLGLGSLLLGVLTLWGLKGLEAKLPREQRAVLTLSANSPGPSQEEITAFLSAANYEVCSISVCYTSGPPRHETRCEVRWQGASHQARAPEFLPRLAENPAIVKVDWHPLGADV